MQHQGLFALQQLARNEVTYETFCQIATEEQVKRELAVAEKKRKEKDKDYYTEDLQSAFHLLEAEFFSAEYQRTEDPWHAVNASSHYRKCNAAQKADELLYSIPADQAKPRS
ncbi:MAG: hypothetical protein ACR65O_07050 [Methylomicrobium sp.]